MTAEPVQQPEPGRDRLPECPEHGLRPTVQGRDFCDVEDDYGHCGRFLIYPEPRVQDGGE